MNTHTHTHTHTRQWVYYINEWINGKLKMQCHEVACLDPLFQMGRRKKRKKVSILLFHNSLNCFFFNFCCCCCCCLLSLLASAEDTIDGNKVTDYMCVCVCIYSWYYSTQSVFVIVHYYIWWHFSQCFIIWCWTFFLFVSFILPFIW